MTFEINDSVVHPKHGVGKITKIIDEELVAGFDQYYVIDIYGTGLTIRIPVVMADELGLRHTMSQPNLQNVIEVLRDKPDQLPGDYKIRQSGIREKLNTAMPVRIAEVVRDLGWRKASAHLSNLDVNLLDESRRLLAGEIAVINDVKFDHALQLIEQNVSVSIVAATAAAESV